MAQTQVIDQLTVVELFAGAGGMSLGLENAGFKPVMLVENDRSCVETLRTNRPEWNVIHEDIRNVDFSGISADLVTGGFPCQPFSHAGHKLGFDDVRGTLFYEFARAVKEIRPKVFMAENVEAILRNNDGQTLAGIMSVLRSLGYEVRYKVLNAVNYGVAQKRKRVFFVGVRGELRYEYPEPSDHTHALRDVLKDVPPSPGATYSEPRKKILELVPEGGSWVDLPVPLQRKYLGASFHSNGGKRGMARRISWDEPCLTLTCSPSQKMTDRIHPEETRPFTVREYARIQSFPDSWEFSGGIGARYKQIGNAVPVNLAYSMACSLRNTLNHVRMPCQTTLSFLQGR